MNNALAWENGCAKDEMRNNFLIPEIVQRLNQKASLKILSVGSGTGFVARNIDKGLTQATWTLIEPDSARLSVCKTKDDFKNKPKRICTSYPTDLLNGFSFDAIIFAFSLLEIRLEQSFLKAVQANLDKNGQVIVAIPDVLEDVLEECKGNEEAFRQYKDGVLDLPKIDKFTEMPYPFYAIRPIFLLEKFFKEGFFLSDMRIFKCSERQFLLFVFKSTAF